MKRTLLDKRVDINDENKILMRLFEESLSKRLDEIFKTESTNLYKDIRKSLKRAICHISVDNGNSSNNN